MSAENEILVEPPTAERVGRELSRWFGNSDFATRARETAVHRDAGRHVDWARVLPFLLMHAACLAVIWVGFSWVALCVTAGALSASHVRHHRFLSSLFFSPHASRLRASDNSYSDCWAPRPCSAGPYGGRHTIATTMCTRISRMTCTRRCSTDFFGATWDGSCRISTLPRTSPG